MTHAAAYATLFARNLGAKMRIARIFKGALAAAALTLAAAPVVAGKEKVEVGQPAPDFTFKLVDGTKVTRDELRGQVVVLNFWATWCIPCRKELPQLDAYYIRHKDEGLRVFAITTEDSLPPYLLKNLFSVMTISPIKGIKGPYATVGNAVPTNIVIGRDGIVRYARPGSFEYADLDATLKPLLAEKAP